MTAGHAAPSPQEPAAYPAAGRCPACGRATQAVCGFAEHVAVIETPDGGISTRTEQRLERRCGWCGAHLVRARAVRVEDLPSL
jgi:hypothetical protein